MRGAPHRQEEATPSIPPESGRIAAHIMGVCAHAPGRGVGVLDREAVVVLPPDLAGARLGEDRW